MSRAMFRGLLGGGEGGAVIIPASYLHYDASALALADGAALAQWDDLTGNGYHAAQSAGASQPTYDANGMGPGVGAVRFTSPRHFLLPNVFGPLTTADVYVALRSQNNAGGQAGLWRLGSSVNGDYYGLSAGQLHNGFGSTTRYDHPKALHTTMPRVYHVRTGPGHWSSRLDSTTLPVSATNTVGWSAAPFLGRNHDGATFTGWIGELRIFSEHLSDAVRDALIADLRTKWQPAIPPLGLFLHHDASTLGLADGASMGTWADASGGGRPATQSTVGSQPTYGANGLSAGKPAVVLAAGRGMRLTRALSLLTEAHIFCVLKRTIGNGSPFFGIAGYTGDSHHYPFGDGVIYDGVGASTRYTVGNPGAGVLDTPHLYHVHTSPTAWTARVNATTRFTTATINPAFNADPYFGLGSWGGAFSEIRIYHGPLTVPERTAIEADLKAKWGLTGY